MTLTQLEAWWFRAEERVEDYSVVEGDPATWEARGRPVKTITGPRSYLVRVPVLAEANGVSFLCPLCFMANHGKVGTHWVYVYFTGRAVPAVFNNGVTWEVTGTDLTDLTVRPSIQLLGGGCAWHGYVTNGEAQ